MKGNIITGKQNVPIILKEERRRSWCSKISLLTLRLVPNVFSSIDLEDARAKRPQMLLQNAYYISMCYISQGR